jgi:hypothetical protein
MHIVIPAAIVLVLLIPAIAIYNQHQRENGKKIEDTKETMKGIFGEIVGYSGNMILAEDGSFKLPAEPIAKLDSWGTEIKIEVTTENAGGIHIFKKAPQVQKLTLSSAGPDTKWGTRDDIVEFRQTTLKKK